MSQSIGLITPKSYTLAAIEQILANYWVIEHIPRVSGKIDLHIQFADDNSAPIYVSIAELDSSMAAEEYGENEGLSEEFKNTLQDSSFYLLSFNSSGLIRDVINRLLQGIEVSPDRLWVDDDYGRIIHLTEFLKLNNQ